MDELNPCEHWAPIPEYEGYFEASDLGRIRSLDRVVPYRGGTPRRLRGHVLKQTVDHSDGRAEVRLSREGKSKTLKVHRLVLLAFRGQCPPGMVGCHNNGDVSNNRPENLRWDTQSENMYDKGRHGTDHKKNRTHCPRSHALEAPNLTPSTAANGHRACLACSRAQANKKRAPQGVPFDFQAAADRHYAQIMDGTYVPRGSRCRQGHLLEAPNLAGAPAAKGLRRCLACKRAGLRKYRAGKRGLLLDFGAEADRYYAEIMAA